MLKPEQVPSEVIRKAMHEFQFQMDEEEHSVGQSWAIIVAAVINAWPGVIHNGHWLMFPHTKLPLPVTDATLEAEGRENGDE